MTSTSEDSKFAELRAKVEARLLETRNTKDLWNAKQLLGVDTEQAKEWEYLKDPLLQLRWVLDQFDALAKDKS